MFRGAVVFFFVVCGSLSAHEDPDDVIDTLTHKLGHAEGADRAGLYFQRASEYRVSGQKEEARSDLLKYTDLAGSDYLGWLELSRMEDNEVKRLEYLARSLEVSDSDAERVKIYYGMAESYYTGGDYIRALRACERSIELLGGRELTALLFKSHLLWRMGRLEERVVFLSKAKGLNGSVVLEREWVDAKIDVGQGAAVMRVVLEEMEKSRFKSSWQIRAALCEAPGSGEAERYAGLAIREIYERLHAERPDVMLLMDLARAYWIMGDDVKVVYYMKLAKAQRYDPWAMAELEENVK